MISLLALAASAPAAIIVDAGGDGDYLTIQEGINAASEGDSVVVRPGMYTGPGNRDLSFGGTNITLTTLGNVQSTIIDCEGAERAFALSNTGEDTTCVIEGFTIRNGSSSEGGAIHASGAALTVQGCVIEDCSTTLNAGGIYFGYNTRLGRPILKDCVLRGNQTVYRGGAVLVAHGSAKIIGCTFIGNSTTAESGASSGGGAVNCNTIEGMTPIASCTFVGNSSAWNGSAIHGYSGIDVFVRTSVIAFCEGGPAMTASGGGYSMIDYNVFYANPGGDYPGEHPDNLVGDPLFCDFYSDDFTLCANSPCLPGGNPWGEHVGAHDTACGECDSPVVDASWGKIKALWR
jgi:hypothetical protein